MLHRMKKEDIGGGVVRRTFRRGDPETGVMVQLLSGHKLTRDEVLAIAPANLDALIDKHFIELFPRAHAEPVDRHIVSLGFAKFDVIEGRKLNVEPMTRENAYALAGVPISEPEGEKQPIQTKAKGKSRR